jgi:hypothetical protein
MKSPSRRTILAFAAGALSAAAVGVGTAAYAFGGTDVVSACYAPTSGALYVIGRDGTQKECKVGSYPIAWNVEGPQGPQGPQGPAGTFSGSFRSPNGLYSLSVTDSGITLAGPSASVNVGASSVSVQGATSVSVQGATVQLNGPGCRPAARLADVVSGSLIVTGSPTVCVG